MLHIHNGDSTADTAKLSTLPGEHFAFREALIEGPAPAARDGAEWRRVRAEHLSAAYGVDLKECERALAEQENKLATFAKCEEVVLWFEHDLFCQLNLIYLLEWFGRQSLGKTKLSLICIGEFPGKENFHGMGELDAAELASLFPGRRPVTQQQLELAKSAWQAYCSTDPTEIQNLLKTDTCALPFLGAALAAHLRRFPSTSNGLGSIEAKSLELIDSGMKNFVDLFPKFGEAESIYGLGDAQLWLALRRISEARKPLLTISGGENGGSDPGSRFHKTAFEMTDVGHSVLKGDADFVAINGIDLWLGGVHLSGAGNLWRWDDDSKALVLSSGGAGGH